MAMTTSLFRAIPRFALPCNAGDLMSACKAFLSQPPPPDTFGFLGNGERFWTKSGRQALRLLLNALGLKPGAGVAVPLFTDLSVISAIAAAGYRPVFIDVEERYLTMDPERLEAARGQFSAVVIVHLFGQMADLPALLTAAGDVPIIEDTAHAPLSSLNGRLAGETGCASFYSFGSTKYWPAGGGGLAVIRDSSLARAFERLITPLRQPSRTEGFKNIVMLSAKAAVFTRPLYPVFGRPLRRWAEQYALLEPPLDDERIHAAHAAIARRQALRFPERVSRQRANSLRLLGCLSHLPEVVLPYERPGARYNYHIFPVLLSNPRERDNVAAAMWRKSVDTSKIYFNIVAHCRRHGYQDGCPVSESVAKRLLTVPNYASLGFGDIDHVAEALISSVRTCRTASNRSAADGCIENTGLSSI